MKILTAFVKQFGLYILLIGLCGYFYNGKRDVELELAEFQKTSLNNYINSLNTSVGILMESSAEYKKLNQTLANNIKANQDENDKLTASIADGTVRVRFLTSELTKAKNRNTLRETGQCNDESGINLGIDDGLHVSNLKKSLKDDRIQIDYLKGYILIILKVL